MIYAYRCPTHGVFDLEFPMGEAPPAAACPRIIGETAWRKRACGWRSPRVFDAVVHFGHGFKPYGDRVQHSKELSRHFGGKD